MNKLQESALTLIKSFDGKGIVVKDERLITQSLLSSQELSLLVGVVETSQKRMSLVGALANLHRALYEEHEFPVSELYLQELYQNLVKQVKLTEEEGRLLQYMTQGD